MPNKSKGGGPKTDKGKAISSRNSITHGLTAKNWVNDDEQELFDIAIQALNQDFNPQSHIEAMLITKLAECTVRLTRIQRVEDAMFDLASSEAEHPEKAIISLDSTNEKLIQAVYNSVAVNRQYDQKAFAKKIEIINEIDHQNLSDVSGWRYMEDHMPITAKYIIEKCIQENIDLYKFISRETKKSNNYMSDVIVITNSSKENTLSIEDILADAQKIKSSTIQKYLNIIVRDVAKDLQVQYILRGLDHRIQQIKDAAMPDTRKLGLVQRYRTSDERQFSKTLGELLKLQEIRNNY